ALSLLSQQCAYERSTERPTKSAANHGRHDAALWHGWRIELDRQQVGLGEVEAVVHPVPAQPREVACGKGRQAVAARADGKIPVASGTVQRGDRPCISAG